MPETSYSPDPRRRPPVWFPSRRYGARGGGYSGGDHSTDPSTDPIVASIRNGLLGYWPLNGNLEDATSYALDFAVAGDSFSWATGKVGQCAQCGVGEAINLSALGSDAHLDIHASFTISCWAKLPSLAGDRGIFNAGNAWQAGYYDGVGFTIYLTGGGGWNAPTTDVLSTDVWYNFIGWWDAGVGLYGSINNGTPVFVATTDTTLADGVPSFSFGATKLGSWTETGTWVNGSLDEVAVWNRVLTSDERAWVYNSGAGRALL